MKWMNDAAQDLKHSFRGMRRDAGFTTQVGIFQYLREQNRSFSDLAGFARYGVGESALTGTGESERLTGVPVTQNFFTLLGVEPMLDRRGVLGEIQHSTARAVRSRLLAEAVCFRPGRAGWICWGHLQLTLQSSILLRTLGSLLFGVTPGDPVTCIGMGALLIVVAAFAGYFSARRALRL